MNEIDTANAQTMVGANPHREAQLSEPESIQRMVSLLGPESNDVVCDAGTGRANAALALAPHVSKVIALDVVDTCSKRFAESDLSKLEFRQADLSDGTIPLSDDSANIVVCRAALHHLDNKDRFFAEAFRVLTPGGRLYVMDPVMSSELRFAWSIISRIAEADYRAYCTEAEMIDGIRRTGFRITYHNHFPFPRSLREWIDGKIIEVDAEGKPVYTRFAEHVRATIWDVVGTWFPDAFREELKFCGDTDDGWFEYTCAEILAVKPQTTS